MGWLDTLVEDLEIMLCNTNLLLVEVGKEIASYMHTLYKSMYNSINITGRSITDYIRDNVLAGQSSIYDIVYNIENRVRNITSYTSCTYNLLNGEIRNNIIDIETNIATIIAKIDGFVNITVEDVNNIIGDALIIIEENFEKIQDYIDLQNNIIIQELDEQFDVVKDTVYELKIYMKNRLNDVIQNTNIRINQQTVMLNRSITEAGEEINSNIDNSRDTIIAEIDVVKQEVNEVALAILTGFDNLWDNIRNYIEKIADFSSADMAGVMTKIFQGQKEASMAAFTPGFGQPQP